ncbi:hypothetical protein ACFXKW_32015 [Streptomyces sp. NPDC059193]|uniref:hypothetical protein n=1 Tax=Streptomyces sp. NPDC059193 TaxID=3346763 RepID=UPI00367E09DC
MPRTLAQPATDTAAVLARLLETAQPHEQTAMVEAAITSGLMWRCTCRAANAPATGMCTACGKARLWTADVTPGAYGELLQDLRSELSEWFQDRPAVPRPAAVSFRITTQYEDGPAWAITGTSFYFTDQPHAIRHDHDFSRTAVADALTEISEYDPPQTGDTLRIALPR